jgi:hypothetical protein
MIVDEDCVLGLDGRIEVTSNRFYDEGLDFFCRDPFYGPSLFSLPVQKCGRDVVAVLDASPAGMARRHPMAAVIEDAAQKKRLRLRPRQLVIVQLLVQFGLDGIEQLAVNDGGLLACQSLAPEDHLSDVKPVAKQISKRAAREGNAADRLACLQGRTLVTMLRFCRFAMSR